MIANGLRLAVGTLTVVPVPAPTAVDRSVARTAMTLAPLAVLPIGLAAAAVGSASMVIGLPALVAAALVVGVVALGSRGLHLDGLADTADGLSASYDRSRALEIMRRGNTGPMGAATLVVVLIIQIASAAAILGRPWGAAAVGVLVCLSRASLLISCAAGVPSARPEGLGATVAGVVPRAVTIVGLMLGAAVAAVAVGVTGSPWWLGAVAVAVGSLTVRALIWRCSSRLGGITGDVLGAGIEGMLAAMFVVAAVTA